MPPPDGCHHNPNEDDLNSPTSPLNFLDQNYQELHQNCLTENTLYNDELFPPDNSSIGLFDDEPLVVDMSQVVWKRPSVTSDENPVHLVRLLNPWGEEEWRGDWSDGSPLWDTVCEEVRKICHEVLNNGEFWMSMEDFTTIFESIDICCSCPDFLDGSSECHWTSKRHFGRWNAGTTAGGDIIKTETFWTNPQFRVTIDELNEDCASGQRPENTLVSLMQNQEKKNRNSQNNYDIGFYVFEIPLEMRSHSGRFSSEFFIEREPVAQTDGLVWLREVMKFFRLEPGEYLIVPCTENPGETASFVLSIFSKNETHFEHIQETSE